MDHISAVDTEGGPVCPIPRLNDRHIQLSHGGGGSMSRKLLMETILPAMTNPYLAPLHDGAILSLGDVTLALSTDSFVVTPHFFPGGSIGDLAVNGTVNDLAMCGARPAFLSVALILEEGFGREHLERILSDMKDAAARAGVSFVSGDTKVVERGKGDGIYINTAGVGLVRNGITIDPRSARPGDAIILSGDIARHGIAIMSVREGLEFESSIESDTTPLHEAASALIDVSPDVRVLRDPTRGGLASALVEIAEASEVGVEIDEDRIPVHQDVRAACGILGFDPLYVANEGKLLAVVPPNRAEAAVNALRKITCSREAGVIGEVTGDHRRTVVLRTSVGGRRVVDMLSGEQLPRIC